MISNLNIQDSIIKKSIERKMSDNFDKNNLNES